MTERAAIVTGASSGIGLAIAHVLGEEGYGLTVAARRPEKLAAAVEDLRRQGYEVNDVAAMLGEEEEEHGTRHNQSPQSRSQSCGVNVECHQAIIRAYVSGLPIFNPCIPC